MGRVYVLKISMKPCKLQGKTAGSQGLIKAGCVKNVGKERKVKNACWWKMPTQGRSARGKNRILNKWKCRNSLCDGLGWKYKMRSKNLSNSPRNGEGWCWKAMRRTTTKWRTSTNEKRTTNIAKTSSEVFTSKVPSLRVFEFWF